MQLLSKHPIYSKRLLASSINWSLVMERRAILHKLSTWFLVPFGGRPEANAALGLVWLLVWAATSSGFDSITWSEFVPHLVILYIIYR